MLCPINTIFKKICGSQKVTYIHRKLNEYTKVGVIYVTRYCGPKTRIKKMTKQN
jgi:hypothetical protein